jgi:hypothetical protein
MFTTLRLTNIGPHQDRALTLSPTADTLIKGPSGSGKSTIAAAIASLLWGDTLNPADTGGDPEIEAVTAKGTTFKRTARGYTYAPAGQPAQTFTTHASYAQTVGAYARNATVGRYILTPHATDDLYTRDRGRAFRDILTAALGADDTAGIVRELMGDNWRDTDPDDLKGALSRQTAANRAEAEAAGAARAAESALARARIELDRVIVPTVEAVDAARQTLALADQWIAYDREAERYVTATHARDRAVAQAVDYDARLTELGARPPMPDTMAARVKVTNAERAVEEARWAIQEAERLERLRTAPPAQAAPPVQAPQFDGPFDAMNGGGEPAPAPLFAAPPVTVPVKIKGFGDHTVTFDGQTATRFDGRPITGK